MKALCAAVTCQPSLELKPTGTVSAAGANRSLPNSRARPPPATAPASSMTNRT